VTLVAALKDASYTTGDIRKVGYAVVAGSEEAGWLLCDGRPVSRSTYAALFAKIGSTYGGGDGSTTFNLPDAQGRSLIGTGQGSGLTNRVLGAKGGAELHALGVGEMPYHGHGGGNHDHGYWTGGESADHAHSGSTDTQGYHSHPAPGGSNFGVGYAQNAGTGTARGSVAGGNTYTENAGSHAHNFGTGGRNAGHSHGITAQAVITAEGGSGAHNNMSPWLAVAVLIKT
jgi:microcystin-dependent protein